MGFDNQAYGQTDIIPGNEPEYMEIGQIQQPSVGYPNHSSEPGDHYQGLNNENGGPYNAYEGLDFGGSIGSQSDA